MAEKMLQAEREESEADEVQTTETAEVVPKAGASGPADEGRGARIQILIALLGALAAIVPAGLGLLGNESPAGSVSTAGVQELGVGSDSELSPAAAALVDQSSAQCSGGSLETEPQDSVSILAPAPDSVVGTKPKVTGHVNLQPAERLYFFTYADGICYFYFDPYGPVVPARDGSWTVTPNLAANAGGTAGLVAAVVGPEGHALLGEILDAAAQKEEDPYVLRLPAGTRLAHSPVQVGTDQD